MNTTAKSLLKKEGEKKSDVNPSQFTTQAKDNLISYIILAVLILVTIIIRSKFFEIPFERDEGVYSYYGKLVLQGKIPYIDFYEVKFPGLYYFYAFVVAVFGDTVKGMHQGFMWLNIITTILLFATARKLFSPLAAVITAATFVFVSITPSLSGFTIQSEHWVAFFSSLGFFFYSFTRSKPMLLYYFLSGVAMGSAFMAKTSGVFMVAAGGLFVISDFIFSVDKKNVKKDLIQMIIRGLTYTAGVGLIVGVFFLIIYFKGAFDEMMFWAYEMPKKICEQYAFF